MSRFVVTADAMGVPTAQIPLPFVRDLTKLLPAEKVVVAYHHQTNQVLVNFPGSDAPTVQKILDELSAAMAFPGEHFATWPGLHLAQPASTDEHPEPTTGGILAQMRDAMQGLTPSQQNRLSKLVCDLTTTLAAERLCFRKLFEAAPDGYVATGFDGTIQQANQAMYQLLHLSAPYLDGKPLLMFFTPGSQSLIQQRLRLLRTGIAESQPFTDIQGQMTLGDESKVSVSMRLIALKSEDAELSTIRWLIRNMT